MAPRSTTTCHRPPAQIRGFKAKMQDDRCQAAKHPAAADLARPLAVTRETTTATINNLRFEDKAIGRGAAQDKSVPDHVLSFRTSSRASPLPHDCVGPHLVGASRPTPTSAMNVSVA